MSQVDEYFVRVALVLDLLPAGVYDRGVTASWVSRGLARKGIAIDERTVLRNLHEVKEPLGLIRTDDPSGTIYWKRSSRHQSISHLLRVDEYIGEPLDKALDSDDSAGMKAYTAPDWSSDIIVNFN